MSASPAPRCSRCSQTYAKHTVTQVNGSRACAATACPEFLGANGKPVAVTKPLASLPIPDLPAGTLPTEADFQEQLRRALNRPNSPLRCWRQNCGGVVTRDRAGRTTGRFNAGPMPGAADLSGLAKGGRRCEIEVKVTHQHTPEQVAFGNVINGMGGLYIVIRYDKQIGFAENVERGVKMVTDALMPVAVDSAKAA